MLQVGRAVARSGKGFAECASIGGVPEPPTRHQIRLVDEVARPTGRDPVLEAALGPALLQQVAAGAPEGLRIYRPSATVGFSGRDCATGGISRAAAAARSAGFAPVRRGPGGRAAAYHRGAVCIDHAGPLPAGSGGAHPVEITPRFIRFGGIIAGALRDLGVDARVGPVPGEYCPGDFSINDGRGRKLVGTAQRLVRGGWLFGTVILVSDPEPVRDVLIEVYRELGLHWDPLTVGAVQDSAPGVGVADVAAAVLTAFQVMGQLVPTDLDQQTLDLAAGRWERHRVPGELTWLSDAPDPAR